MDSVYDMVSESSDFRSLYIAEKNKLSVYGLVDPFEYFAEVFMYSLLQPETTAELCPRSYKFVTDIAKAF